MRSTHYDAHETERMHALHGVELASFGSRAAAIVIDFAIAGVLFMAVVYPVGRLLVDTGAVAQPESDVVIRFNFVKNWYSVLWTVAYFGFATYLGNGRTPGKRLLGIRVVSLVHERLGLWHALERALGYGASALEFGFGFAQYFLERNRRTVHDRIAQTIVVRERALAAVGAEQAPSSH
jgi:uncharacterized RDD family membrane protein YckC